MVSFARFSALAVAMLATTAPATAARAADNSVAPRQICQIGSACFFQQPNFAGHRSDLQPDERCQDIPNLPEGARSVINGHASEIYVYEQAGCKGRAAVIFSLRMAPQLDLPVRSVTTTAPSEA